MKTESVPHPKWLHTNMFTHSVVSWTVEQLGCIFSVTIAGFPVLDSAIGNGFLMLLWAFAKSYLPHMPKFCMPTFGNGRNNAKTACICLYRVLFATCIGKPGAILSARKHQANVISGQCRDSARLCSPCGEVGTRSVSTVSPPTPLISCHWVLRVSLQKCANLVTVRTD